MAQGLIKVVHAAGLAARIVDNRLHTLGPLLLEIDFLARLCLRLDGFRGLGSRNNISLSAAPFGQQVAQHIDATQRNAVDSEARKRVHGQQKKEDKTRKNEGLLRIFHDICCPLRP